MQWAYPVEAWDNHAELMAFRGDFETNLKHLQELGYQGVELLVRDVRQLNRERLLSLLMQYNLRLAAFSTAPIEKQDGLHLSDTCEKGQHCMERLKELISYARGLKVPVLIGKIRGNVSSEVQSALVTERITELSDFAQASDVPLLLEPQNSLNINFLNTVAETSDFFESHGLDCMGFHLDTFHLASGEADVSQAIAQAGIKTGFLHIADSGRAVPGQGTLPLYSYLSQLSALLPDLWISPEIRQLPSSQEAATAAMVFFRTLE